MEFMAFYDGRSDLSLLFYLSFLSFFFLSSFFFLLSLHMILLHGIDFDAMEKMMVDVHCIACLVMMLMAL